jgi:hypothetical protein
MDQAPRSLSSAQQEILKQLLTQFVTANASEISGVVDELSQPEIDTSKLRAAEKKAFLAGLPWALQAQLQGTEYQKGINFMSVKGGRSLVVNNPEIGKRLKADFTATGEFSRQGFQELFELLKQKGTFGVNVDSKGLAVTSGVEAHINAQMSIMRWYSDTIWITRELLTVEKPEACQQALFSLAQVYMSQEDMFKRLIQDPTPYHQGGKLDGIAHIFDGATFKLNEDFNRRRLEGHGMAMKAFADAIQAGFVAKQNYGFSESKLKSADFDAILSSIAYLADYFNSIRFYAPDTRTTGNWEEMPFERSMWDTTAITLAFESVKDLMTNPAYDANANIQYVREQLRKRSIILANPDQIDALINKGWNAVRSYYPFENASRAFDASAVWTAAFAKLDSDPLQDIQKRMNILRMTSESLLGDYGLRRYNGDSYLATNYEIMSLVNNRGQLHLPGTKKLTFESNDVSDEASFAARGALLVKGFEAQWVLPIPVMAIAYSRLLNQALELQKAQPADLKLKNLVTDLWTQENFYIARTFAAVTPENYTKSNGHPGAAWAIPEAYESVTLLQNFRGDDHIGFMVGANTPLTWSVANAFDAFNRFAKDLGTMGGR